ncbi:MAG: c-type cytochrome [Opitutaceae bacterium]|nr:c-type cytochrome [Opitutaceae bacterium]
MPYLRCLPLLVFASFVPPAAGADPGPLQIFPAVPPEAVGRTFRVQDGFTMDLLAAEPLVASPVALAYDEDGGAFVAEMRDYPYTDKRTHQPWVENTTDASLGRIRRLVDDDGDGRFDRSVIFAEGLSWPTGIACWQGGIYVTATPDIWYLKDTDGDHRADVRIKVFTGFRKYNIQTAVNSPLWGIDNRITIAVSSNGGTLTRPGQPAFAPLKLGGRDLRIDPRDHTLELITGGTARFGQSYDDWGNRFLCSASNPAFHVVSDGTRAARNPYLSAPNPVHDVRGAGGTLPVHRISPLEPWRVIQSGRWQAARETSPRKELTPGGTVTSATGITIYRGSAYPEKYHGQAFVGEVANNVVHRQTVAADGVTFRFAAADQEAEFVASNDTWFRPVNFVNAPDGTLHIVDMYRETVEHPWSVPDDLHAKLDLTSGRERGRLYRLAPPGFRPPPPPRLGRASTAALVATLEHRDAWWRETAQRLLFERRDAAAVAPLRTLLAASPHALARVHALWTLDGLAALREDDLVRALNDPSAGVREHAVRLAAARIDAAPALRTRVVALAGDDAIRVRYQVALAAAGGTADSATDVALALLARDADDRWVRAAALGGPPEHAVRLAERVLREPSRWSGPGGREVVRQLLFSVGAQSQRDALDRVWNAFAATPAAPERERLFWSGLGEGLRQGNRTLRSAFPVGSSPAAARVAALLDQAQRDARATTLPVADRLEAVRLLAQDEFARVHPVLSALLSPGEVQPVQLAAVRTLAGFTGPAVGPLLLRSWSGYTPAVRDEVVTALMNRRERTGELLAALEQQVIGLGQLSPARRAQLLGHPDPALKARAAKIFGQGPAGSRAAAVENYRAALALPGDAARGRVIFEQACAACHRLGGRGADLGPALETVRGWDRPKLVLHILDPNREVAPGYLVYTLELKDGSSLSGMISEESAGSITLRRMGAPAETILRQNLVRVTSSSASLMPEGLEGALSVPDMADLLACLTAP